VVVASLLGAASAAAQPPAVPMVPPGPMVQPGPAVPPGPAQPASWEAPPPEPDPVANTLIQAAITFGSAAQTNWDRALEAHGYASSEGVWGGDATVLLRVSSWLFMGGRAGVRQRRWPRIGDGDLSATGGDLIAMGEARWQLGRIVALGMNAGIGLGHVSVVVRETASAGVSFRAVGGGFMAYRLALRLHALVRVGAEWFRWRNVNRFGHDVDLGGISLSLGIELRT
jgi:hypothetical protein